MKAIDRRGLLRGILFATGATAVGVTFVTHVSEALPLDARIATLSNGLIQKAQVVIVAPPSPPLGLLVEQRPARLRVAMVLKPRIEN